MRKSLILALASALVTTTHAANPVRMEYMGTAASGGWWTSAAAWKDLTTGTTGKSWSDGNIAVFNETENQVLHKIQMPSGKDQSPYGIEVKTSNSSYAFKFVNASATGIGGIKLGAGGLSVKSYKTDKIGFQFSRPLALTASQTWSNTDLSDNKFPKANVYVGANTAISATDYRNTPSEFTLSSGNTLTLNAVNLVVTAPGDFAGASVYADAASGLCITTDGEANRSMLNAERITMDGSTLTLDANPDVAGDGQFNVAQTVELKNGGKVVGANGIFDVETVQASGTGNVISGTYATAPSFALSGSGALETATDITVTSLEDYTGTAITISAGILFLPDMIDWPDGLVVTTTGTGVLKLQTKDGYDESRLGGTKNVTIVDDEWKVTDEIVTETELSVDDGKELHIYGNGLKAATTLILNGGKVIFEDSKTIASPVIQRKTSTIMTADASVIGTLTGKITDDGDTTKPATDPGTHYLLLDGLGKIVLSGGIDFDCYAGVKLIGGNADLISGEFTFGRDNGAAASNYGGTLSVLANGKWLTIKDGATVTLTRASKQADSIVDITSGQGGIDVATGGTFFLDNQRTLTIGNSTTADNMLKVSGGTLNLFDNYGSVYIGKGSYGCGTLQFDSGTIICNKSLHGTAKGKVIWNGGTWKWSSKNNVTRLLLDKALAINVNGSDCVLDLTEVANNKTITPNDAANCTAVSFSDDGCLTILSDKANNALFQANTPLVSSHVVLSNATLQTYATIVASSFNVVEFGANAKFDATAQAQTIGTLVIKEGGEWNGGANLVNATFDNLTFENGSILNVTTADTLEFSGTLTLPEHMQYGVSATGPMPHDLVAISAGEIIQVDPAEPRKTEWTVVPGMRVRGYGAPEVSGNLLAMHRSGCALLIR